MSEIKSLADELRESIRKGTETENPKNGRENEVVTKSKRSAKRTESQEMLSTLFTEILSHELTGKEKLMIRLDDKTVFLLKQLKVSKGIDMNKIISYSLQYFFQKKPELIQYIKESLKSVEL